MTTQDTTQLQELFNKAKRDSFSCWRTRSKMNGQFAAKSIGEIEGYLNCMKDNGLISSDEYAKQYEAMCKLWQRL